MQGRRKVSSPKQHLPKDMQHSVGVVAKQERNRSELTAQKYGTRKNNLRTKRIEEERTL